MTPELAEICGIHAGDGYLRRRRKNKTELEFAGSLEEKGYYDEHVIPLFNKVFNLNLKGRILMERLYGFVVWNKKIGNLFHELGFPYGKKTAIVSVPKLILDSGDKILYARFLRGLLDTDRHIGFRKCYGKYIEFKIKHHHYPLIHITTISKKLVEEVCFMLNKLEIKYFVVEGQPKNPRASYMYRIIINGVDRFVKWMKIIGSKNPVKFSRYLVWKRFGFCPTNLTLKQRENILKGKLNIYSMDL